MEKKKIILPSKKFFGSSEEDLNIRLGLDESRNLLREGDRTIILDNSVLFAKERNESPNYKIHGKLKMVFRNMYSGETLYDTLQERLYLVGDGSAIPPGASSKFIGFLPYDEFAFLRKDVYREVNLITGGTSNLDFYTPNIQLTGTNPHQSISSIEAPYHNWNIYLSYVYSGDTQFPIKYTLSGNTVYSFVSGDGIPFRVTDNGNTYTLICPVEHGMIAGEYITISGGTLDNSVPVSGRTFSINSVGDSFFRSEKFVLEINKSEMPSGTTLSTVVLGKRCIDRNNITGTTSTYYVHKHKTLTEEKDYILDKVGFESPIWENERKLLLENSAGTNDYLVERNRMESLIYDFKNSFVLTGLTNNLGYLPTEVYVTVVLINANGYFDYPPKVGFKFNFHDSWADEHFNGSSSIETTIPTTGFSRTVASTTFNFTGGTELPLNTILTGAFIEYNEYELKERVVSEAFHKFSNPTNIFDYYQEDSDYYSGASPTNKTGIYYQPHYRVKLRQLSPYVESSTTNDIYGLPQNAKYSEDERLWKWHDLYDHGFIDPDGFGTNFPFMNYTHYVKNDINFYLRNERLYTNKNDGIKKFDKFDC
jgi:hypothetical protein